MSQDTSNHVAANYLGSMPFHCAVFNEIVGSDISDKFRNLGQVTPDEHQRLLGLIKHLGFESALELNKFYGGPDIRYDRHNVDKIFEKFAHSNIFGDLRKVVNRDFSKYNPKINELSMQANNKLSQVPENFDVEIWIDSLKELWLEADTILKTLRNSGLTKRITRELKKIVDSEASSPEARVMLHTINHFDEGITLQLISAKADRASTLLKIDEDISRLYLRFTPLVVMNMDYEFYQRSLSIQNPEENGITLVVDTPRFYEMDSMLYLSIINSLDVIDDKDHAKENYDVNENNQELSIRIPKLTFEDRFFKKLDSMIRIINLTEDMKFRLNHFGVAAIDYLTETKLIKLTNNLDESKLPRYMRKYETRLSEIEFRSLFDDLELGYIRQGQVPNSCDVKNAYEEILAERA